MANNKLTEKMVGGLQALGKHYALMEYKTRGVSHSTLKALERRGLSEEFKANRNCEEDHRWHSKWWRLTSEGKRVLHTLHPEALIRDLQGAKKARAQVELRKRAQRTFYKDKTAEMIDQRAARMKAEIDAIAELARDMLEESDDNSGT
jgi:hypothetical protein